MEKAHYSRETKSSSVTRRGYTIAVDRRTMSLSKKDVLSSSATRPQTTSRKKILRMMEQELEDLVPCEYQPAALARVGWRERE